MTDTCGPMLPTPFAYYDPDTSSVKTSQGTFPWVLTESSLTLPRWGSMRNGELYARPTPERLTAATDCSSLLPTPHANASTGPGRQGRAGGENLQTAITLLPTPAGRDHKGRNQRNDATCLPGALLPTPRATDGTKGGPNQAGSSGDLMLPSAVQPERFGPYAAAVARWEQVLGRPAPEPSEPAAKGGRRLSAAFVEWLMGAPDGWVTGCGIPRDAQSKMLGNGCVPQQVRLALTLLDGAR